MDQIHQLYRLFCENFPAAVREAEHVKHIFSHPEITVLSRREGDRLIAAAVVWTNSITMLAVDAPFRHQGIGSELLAQAEALIHQRGYDSVTVGVGPDYLTPGVPVRTMPFKEAPKDEILHPALNDEAWQFFVRCGYYNSWDDCNCFDMCMELANYPQYPHKIGDAINGITYRWASAADLPGICECTDAAEEGFTPLYRVSKLYAASSPHRVLLAELDGRICGVLQVLFGVEAPSLGSIGCTAVHPDFQGRHIAVNLVMLGTKALKEAGLPRAYLGYTYSGLEHLYGKAGYKVSCYYAMAEKNLAD